MIGCNDKRCAVNRRCRGGCGQGIIAGQTAAIRQGIIQPHRFIDPRIGRAKGRDTIQAQCFRAHQTLDGTKRADRGIGCAGIDFIGHHRATDRHCFRDNRTR